MKRCRLYDGLPQVCHLDWSTTADGGRGLAGALDVGCCFILRLSLQELSSLPDEILWLPRLLCTSHSHFHFSTTPTSSKPTKQTVRFNDHHQRASRDQERMTDNRIVNFRRASKLVTSVNMLFVLCLYFYILSFYIVYTVCILSYSVNRVSNI